MDAPLQPLQQQQQQQQQQHQQQQQQQLQQQEKQERRLSPILLPITEVDSKKKCLSFIPLLTAASSSMQKSFSCIYSYKGCTELFSLYGINMSNQFAWRKNDTDQLFYSSLTTICSWLSQKMIDSRHPPSAQPRPVSSSSSSSSSSSLRVGNGWKLVSVYVCFDDEKKTCGWVCMDILRTSTLLNLYQHRERYMRQDIDEKLQQEPQEQQRVNGKRSYHQAFTATVITSIQETLPPQPQPPSLPPQSQSQSQPQPQPQSQSQSQSQSQPQPQQQLLLKRKKTIPTLQDSVVEPYDSGISFIPEIPKSVFLYRLDNPELLSRINYGKESTSNASVDLRRQVWDMRVQRPHEIVNTTPCFICGEHQLSMQTMILGHLWNAQLATKENLIPICINCNSSVGQEPILDYFLRQNLNRTTPLSWLLKQYSAFDVCMFANQVQKQNGLADSSVISNRDLKVLENQRRERYCQSKLF